MDTMEFCKLAVSKDDTRFNLLEVYRDKTEFVGCDRHRVHWSDGLPEVTPHYPSGLNAEYPDWRQILPKTPAYGTAKIMGTGVNFSRLRGLLAYAKTAGFKSQCVEVLSEHNTLTINFSSGNEGIKASLNFPAETETPFRVGVELRYLIDALKPIEKSHATATIEFREALQIIIISYEGAGINHFHAGLMPIRLAA